MGKKRRTLCHYCRKEVKKGTGSKVDRGRYLACYSCAKKWMQDKMGKKVTKKHRVQDASGGHDVKSRRKFHRGGRVEAYTMGEASGSKRWP